MAELEQLQGWLQRAVLSGGAAAEHAGAVVAPSPTMAPAERVAVYARGYRARLNEMLRGEYPALRRFMGDAVFLPAHVHDGLPHKRVGRRALRFRLSEVDAWNASRNHNEGSRTA